MSERSESKGRNPKREDWRGTPHPSRLDPTRPDRYEILRRHEAAMASGLSTYRDPATGFTVMTAQYLADRDHCCNTGCRHCPWEGADDG
ncbi:MAG: hypothetical protein KF906_02415 [Actinobacteria bacterium]|nr:hypothetical protein [Actinomycetota bacterium]